MTDANEWMCDIPWFMVQLYEDPDFIVEFIEIFLEWSMKQIEFAIEAGVDVIQYRGWYDIPNFWGQKFWRKHILPIVQTQAKAVHDAGKIMSYLLTEGHGEYTNELKEADVDILFGIDPRVVRGVGLEGLRDELGASKCFWGGVNNEVTLESCNAERIEDEVKRTIDILDAHNGLVLSSMLCAFSTRAAGMQHMIDAWRKHNKAR